MSKKVILVLMGIVFFSVNHFAFASLIINEVMYDLSGADSVSSKSKEWVEIYNPDASDVAVDASAWRMYDGSLNRTINGEVDFTIPAGSYIVFAGDKDTFLSEYASFRGVVYDTGITSLNNTGAILKILDQDGNEIDSATYDSSQGGSGDGNSLQLINGSWVGATPTPGEMSREANETVNTPLSNSNDDTTNSNTATNTNTNTNTNTGGNASKSTKTEIKMIKNPTMKVKILANTLAFAGEPLEMKTSVFGYYNEDVVLGRAYWNFGDGASLEQVNNFEKFHHTYYYPGEYVVYLEYYLKSSSKNPEVTNKMTIKVVPTTVTISQVGDIKDFFIELSNNASSEIDISNWFIKANGKTFNLPKNSVILSKKQMTISSKITGFVYDDRYNLKLFSSTGELIFEYLPSIVSNVKAVNVNPNKNTIQSKPLSKPLSVDTQPPKKVASALEIEIPTQNLEASVINSDSMKNDSNKSYLPILISVIFIGVSAGAVYSIRQKKVTSNLGDDFKILDE